jgi:hypothetical protein
LEAGVRTLAAWTVIAAAFAGGLALAQERLTPEERAARRAAMQEKLKHVRREVKLLDLDATIARLPEVLKREKDDQELIERMLEAAKAGTDVRPMMEQGRQLKLAALDDFNEILKLHRGKHVGIREEEVWNRLRSGQFEDVSYEDEWLVNILDDLEAALKINIELDARVYKFDTVSFEFEKTSARAMLQIMGDSLYFKWLIRGDTLYVYKERHEVLFGGEWIRQKKAAWKARKEALAKAAKEAERRALEGEEAEDK